MRSKTPSVSTPTRGLAESWHILVQYLSFGFRKGIGAFCDSFAGTPGEVSVVYQRSSTVTKENCADRYKSNFTASGVFKIDPDDLRDFDVFCDQEKAGGGWTVFQKRLDGSVDFYRNWTDYKQGFGNLSGEFWLRLDKIHRLTSQTKNKLRIELEDFDGNTSYAEYDTFAVADEAHNYTLSVAGYKGNHEVRASLVNSAVLLTDFGLHWAISNSCMQHSRREGGIGWVANSRLLPPPSPRFFWNRIREIIRTADKVNAHNYLIQYALVQSENIHDFLLDIMYRSINSKLASTCTTSRRNATSKHEIETPNKIPTPLVLWSNAPPQGRWVFVKFPPHLPPPPPPSPPTPPTSASFQLMLDSL